MCTRTRRVSEWGRLPREPRQGRASERVCVCVCVCVCVFVFVCSCDTIRYKVRVRGREASG